MADPLRLNVDLRAGVRGRSAPLPPDWFTELANLPAHWAWQTNTVTGAQLPAESPVSAETIAAATETRMVEIVQIARLVTVDEELRLAAVRAAELAALTAESEEALPIEAAEAPVLQPVVAPGSADVPIVLMPPDVVIEFNTNTVSVPQLAAFPTKTVLVVPPVVEATPLDVPGEIVIAEAHPVPSGVLSWTRQLSQHVVLSSSTHCLEVDGVGGQTNRYASLHDAFAFIKQAYPAGSTAEICIMNDYTEISPTFGVFGYESTLTDWSGNLIIRAGDGVTNPKVTLSDDTHIFIGNLTSSASDGNPILSSGPLVLNVTLRGFTLKENKPGAFFTNKHQKPPGSFIIAPVYSQSTSPFVPKTSLVVDTITFQQVNESMFYGFDNISMLYCSSTGNGQIDSANTISDYTSDINTRSNTLSVLNGSFTGFGTFNSYAQTNLFDSCLFTNMGLFVNYNVGHAGSKTTISNTKWKVTQLPAPHLNVVIYQEQFNTPGSSFDKPPYWYSLR